MNEKVQDFRGLSALPIGNKQSIQENTSSEQQNFTGYPDFTLGVGAWGESSP